jgi:hypothetical protein
LYLSLSLKVIIAPIAATIIDIPIAYLILPNGLPITTMKKSAIAEALVNAAASVTWKRSKPFLPQQCATNVTRPTNTAKGKLKIKEQKIASENEFDVSCCASKRQMPHKKPLNNEAIIQTPKKIKTNLKKIYIQSALNFKV